MDSCNCDLCGSKEFLQFPLSMTGEPPVVVCSICGLIYTNPRFSRLEVEAFYASEFAADPGAAGFTDSNAAHIEHADFNEAIGQLRTTIFPFVQHYVRPQGKKWLELRFRTGAIFNILVELGADIWGVDIFQANVQAAKHRFQRDTFFTGSVFDLLGPVHEIFDVISALSIHVLAHAPSPSQLLADIRDHLTEDGMLVIEEKDVSEIPRGTQIFPLAYPNQLAHYHHMTLASTRAFVEKSGFEILYADFIPRTSALRHFLIVARKARLSGAVAAPPRAGDPQQLFSSMLEHFETFKGSGPAQSPNVAVDASGRGFTGAVS